MTAINPDAVRRMYSSEESYRIRLDTHERYTVPPIDFIGWSLGCVKWRGDETILDIGSGPGLWFNVIQEKFPQATYFGNDLYAGMLHNHPAPQRVNVADIQNLPYPDATFDVVMANHVLFHVPDIEQAIRECRRVLKPGGIFMGTTNSTHNMPELQVLVRRAVTLLVPPGTTNIQVPAPHTEAYTLETGTRLLSRQFFAVVRYDLPSQLIFPEVEPILAYLESTRSVREPELPAGVQWDDVMLIVREQVSRLIEHFGELVINKLAGNLVATDRGDFIREYLDHKAKSNGSPTS